MLITNSFFMNPSIKVKDLEAFTTHYHPGGKMLALHPLLEQLPVKLEDLPQDQKFHVPGFPAATEKHLFDDRRGLVAPNKEVFETTYFQTPLALGTWTCTISPWATRRLIRPSPCWQAIRMPLPKSIAPVTNSWFRSTLLKTLQHHIIVT